MAATAIRSLLSATAVISISVFCAAAETPLDKRISVDYREKALPDVLKDIEAQTGVHFAFDEKLAAGHGPVTYAARDQQAGRVATRILRPRGMKLERTEGNPIAIAKLDALDEFRVKPEPVFEFAEKPKATRDGDKVTVSFAANGFCDATVAIEDASGRIVRHLASGVLGDNAPEPFQWNSKRQTLVWDGKDDQGAYVDDREGITIRVSLGLRPRFERTLYWEPKKRLGAQRLSIRAAPEGVYVYDAGDLDQLRLFDHDGNYVRTIYPFPAAKLEAVNGMDWFACPQDGLRVPVRTGGYPSSVLPLEEGLPNNSSYNGSALALRGERILVAGRYLLRLAADGSTGGLRLRGPRCTFSTMHKRSSIGTARMEDVSPIGAAIAPDGKTLYLTGYGWSNGYDGFPYEWLNGVARVDLTGDAEPKVFAGGMKQTPGYNNEGGTEPGRFRVPASVACDRQGRVYVADHMNDRIQVFSSDGKFLKAIPVAKPVALELDPRSDDLWVFSWRLNSQYNRDPASAAAKEVVRPLLTRLGSFDAPAKTDVYPLPMAADYPIWEQKLPPFVAALDFWATPPAVWLVADNVSACRDDHPVWERAGIRILTLREKALELKEDFGKATRKSVGLVRPPPVARGRLAVEPRSGKLYLGEGVPIEECAYFKAFNEVAEIDPETGKVRVVPLPLHSQDLCFDLDGHAYLRGAFHVVRYDPSSWREVPWDYGENVRAVTYGTSPAAHCMGALPLPGLGRGGFCVSPLGFLAAAHQSGKMGTELTSESENVFRRAAYEAMNAAAPKPYQPRLYPGRVLGGRLCLVHVFNEHGQLVRGDAVQGLNETDGLKIDRNGNLYVLDAERPLVDGKAVFRSHPFHFSGTLMKFAPGRGRLVSGSDKAPIPLARGAGPSRPQELDGKWVEGLEWTYGGVGLSKNCFCTSTGFDLDLFARTFAPEPVRGKVAVLDSNGNLILRVGRIGNADDGKPLVLAGGPPNPQSVGGDETALFWPTDVATHSDRRLFVRDWGNARIVSVKLGYHAEEKIALKNVADTRKEPTP